MADRGGARAYPAVDGGRMVHGHTSSLPGRLDKPWREEKRLWSSGKRMGKTPRSKIGDREQGVGKLGNPCCSRFTADRAASKRFSWRKQIGDRPRCHVMEEV